MAVSPHFYSWPAFPPENPKRLFDNPKKHGTLVNSGDNQSATHSGDTVMNCPRCFATLSLSFPMAGNGPAVNDRHCTSCGLRGYIAPGNAFVATGNGELCQGCYADPCECLPDDCNCDPSIDNKAHCDACGYADCRNHACLDERLLPAHCRPL